MLRQCRVELHHGGCFGDAIIAFFGHYEVGQKSGSKFVPQNSRLVQFDSTLTQSYVQPQNSPIQKLRGEWV